MDFHANRTARQVKPAARAARKPLSPGGARRATRAAAQPFRASAAGTRAKRVAPSAASPRWAAMLVSGSLCVSHLSRQSEPRRVLLEKRDVGLGRQMGGDLIALDGDFQPPLQFAHAARGRKAERFHDLSADADRKPRR